MKRAVIHDCRTVASVLSVKITARRAAVMRRYPIAVAVFPSGAGIVVLYPHEGETKRAASNAMGVPVSCAYWRTAESAGFWESSGGGVARPLLAQ